MLFGVYERDAVFRSSFPGLIKVKFQGSKIIFLSHLDLEMLNPCLRSLIKHCHKFQSIHLKAEHNSL